MLDEKLNQVFEFTVEEWCNWLTAVLNGQPTTPKLEIGTEELDAVLLGVYEDVGKKQFRDRFAEALFLVYESTPYIEGHEEILHVILSLIASVKPIGAKSLLTRHLINEEALNLRLELPTEPESYSSHQKRVRHPVNLHSLLLSVLSEYDLNDRMKRYIYHSSASIKNLEYSLVCFRVLAADDERAGYQFIPRVLATIDEEFEVQDLAFEIKAELKRNQYKEFFTWYTENAGRVADEFPSQFALLEDFLRDQAIPPILEVASENDPYLRLLTIQLHANRVRYSSEEIIAIARMHALVGISLICGVLRNIWRRNGATNVEPAWSYITLNVNFVGGYSATSDKRAIEVVGDDGEIRGVQFNVVDDPDLELIFEQMHTLDVLGANLDEIERRFRLEEEVLVEMAL